MLQGVQGHTTYAGAAEVVLTSLFGERPGRFSLASATANGAVHRYESFGEVADEVVNARVWVVCTGVPPVSEGARSAGKSADTL